jgi:hypothetical protein
MVKKPKPTTRTGLEGPEKPTPMDLSPPHILATLVGSGVGFVYLNFGRSEADWPLAASGLALMTYGFLLQFAALDRRGSVRVQALLLTCPRDRDQESTVIFSSAKRLLAQMMHPSLGG